MKEIELKPCPFCGGEAEVKKTKIYYDDAVQIHCTECNVHTTALPFNCKMYFDGKNGYMTEQTAIERTVKKWNRRADNEKD